MASVNSDCKLASVPSWLYTKSLFHDIKNLTQAKNLFLSSVNPEVVQSL